MTYVFLLQSFLSCPVSLGFEQWGFATFGTFCVRMGRFFEGHCVFKDPKHCDFGDIFHQKWLFVDFQVFFKDSLRLK